MDTGNSAFLDKFSNIAARIGNLAVLTTLRDAFATIIPLFVLGGIAVLVNNVLLPLLPLPGDMLAQAQNWGTMVNNGTMNMAALAIAPVCGFCLARTLGFENQIACAIISLSCFIILMPLNVEAALASDADATAVVTAAIVQNNIGSNGLFTGIIAGLASTGLFVKLSQVDKLRINLGENVPPMVSQSFNVLVPMMLVASLFGLVSAVLLNVFDTDVFELVRLAVQTPLKSVGTSLPGVLLIYGVALLLFSVGIHHSTITDSILTPITMLAMTENTAAFAAGEAIPNIITYNTIALFGQIGGAGATLSLIIITLLWGKNEVSKNVSKLALVPGLFNINEPIVYGYPIVYNLPLMIPFVAVPLINIALYYFAVASGLIGYSVSLVPWTTPPVISGLLSSGMDWRNAVFMVLLLVLDAAIWFPFMRVHERVQEKQVQMAA